LSAILPIRFLDCDGRATADYRGAPCVSVGFCNHPTEDQEYWPYDECVALVDTGSDEIYVDRALVEKFKCPLSNGDGWNGYRGCLVIKEIGEAFPAVVFATDLGQPFHIILGRRFLNRCDLNWSGHRNIFQLWVRSRAGT
jgi:hypothetical protein